MKLNKLFVLFEARSNDEIGRLVPILIPFELFIVVY